MRKSEIKSRSHTGQCDWETPTYCPGQSHDHICLPPLPLPEEKVKNTCELLGASQVFPKATVRGILTSGYNQLASQAGTRPGLGPGSSPHQLLPIPSEELGQDRAGVGA